jgi:hypothetical protein
MYKKITMAMAIAAILTAYISALTVSNQAFAQGTSGNIVVAPGATVSIKLNVAGGQLGGPPSNTGGGLVGQVLAGQEPNRGTASHAGLFGQTLAGHEAQLCKVLSINHPAKQFGITIPPKVSLKCGL